MDGREFCSMKPMLLSIDGASVRVRQRLIADEKARAPAGGPKLARTA